MKNQKIERIMNELNIELRYFNEFSEIGLKISEFRELSDNEEFNQNFQIIDEEKNLKIIRNIENNQNILKIKIIQIHIQKNQDIKLEMMKIDRVLVPLRGLFVINPIRHSPVNKRLCGPFCGAKSKICCSDQY